VEKKFLESILGYVASQVRENKILSKDKLIKYVWNDCFPQGSEKEYGEFEHLIAQHIDHVLNPQVSKPIVRFLDHKCEGE